MRYLSLVVIILLGLSACHQDTPSVQSSSSAPAPTKSATKTVVEKMDSAPVTESLKETIVTRAEPINVTQGKDDSIQLPLENEPFLHPTEPESILVTSAQRLVTEEILNNPNQAHVEGIHYAKECLRLGFRENRQCRLMAAACLVPEQSNNPNTVDYCAGFEALINSVTEFGEKGPSAYQIEEASMMITILEETEKAIRE